MIQPSTQHTALHQLSDQAPAQRIRRRYTVTQVVVMVLVMGVGGRGQSAGCITAQGIGAAIPPPGRDRARSGAPYYTYITRQIGNR